MEWIIFAVVIAALVWWTASVKSEPAVAPVRPAPLGDAAWATPEDNQRRGLLDERMGSGIPLGFQRIAGGKGPAIRYHGPNALILVGPPRKGKFTDYIAAALMETGLGNNPASCIVIDPKGQAAAVTAAHRARMGQRVIFLSPFHAWPGYLGPDNPAFTDWPEAIYGPRPKNFEPDIIFDAHYNPMPLPASQTFAEECTSRADGCVIVDRRSRDAHFDDKARQLIATVIGEVAEGFPEEYRNLATVADIIAGGAFSIGQVAKHSAARGASDFIRKGFQGYLGLEDAKNLGELESIFSSAIRQMSFINASPNIAENLRGTSSFDWASMRHTATTVYLILPLSQQENSKKWFRLVIESACTALMDEGNDGPLRTLLLMDEFTQSVGRLDVMTTVMNSGAGRGLQAWPILQCLPDLKELYGERYESFLGAAGVQIFMASRDNTSSDYIQRRSGVRTVEVPQHSESVTFAGGQVSRNISNSISLHQMPLLHAYQASQMLDNSFVMIDESGCMTAGYREPYWLNYQGMFSPDPNEKHRAANDNGGMKARATA